MNGHCGAVGVVDPSTESYGCRPPPDSPLSGPLRPQFPAVLAFLPCLGGAGALFLAAAMEASWLRCALWRPLGVAAAYGVGWWFS